MLINNADQISGLKGMKHLTLKHSRNTSSSSTNSNKTGNLFGFPNGQKCGKDGNGQKCGMETAKKVGHLFRALSWV
jgi:hypothetical protein